jgi:hypothetical protein
MLRKFYSDKSYLGNLNKLYIKKNLDLDKRKIEKIMEISKIPIFICVNNNINIQKFKYEMQYNNSKKFALFINPNTNYIITLTHMLPKVRNNDKIIKEAGKIYIQNNKYAEAIEKIIIEMYKNLDSKDLYLIKYYRLLVKYVVIDNFNNLRYSKTKNKVFSLFLIIFKILFGTQKKYKIDFHDDLEFEFVSIIKKEDLYVMIEQNKVNKNKYYQYLKIMVGILMFFVTFYFIYTLLILFFSNINNNKLDLDLQLDSPSRENKNLIKNNCEIKEIKDIKDIKDNMSSSLSYDIISYDDLTEIIS